MENLIQRLTDNGDVIVQFFCAVASGQPFMMRYVEKLPRTPEQEAVAQGIATPEQKAAAGGAQERQARSQRLERPHERQQRHALSNPNDKMDPIRKRDLPTWAKSANAREHDLLAVLRRRLVDDRVVVSERVVQRPPGGLLDGPPWRRPPVQPLADP